MANGSFNPQAMLNLDAMWEGAGRPAGKEPWRWLENEGKTLVFRELDRGIGIGHVVSTTDPQFQESIDRIYAEWCETSTSQWNYHYAMRVEAAAWAEWSAQNQNTHDRAAESSWLEYLNKALDRDGIHTNRWAGEYPERFPKLPTTPTA